MTIHHRRSDAMNHAELAAALNGDLAHEFSAVIQYMT